MAPLYKNLPFYEEKQMITIKLIVKKRFQSNSSGQQIFPRQTCIIKMAAIYGIPEPEYPPVSYPGALNWYAVARDNIRGLQFPRTPN
jgi:hypothetical protein